MNLVQREKRAVVAGEHARSVCKSVGGLCSLVLVLTDDHDLVIGANCPDMETAETLLEHALTRIREGKMLLIDKRGGGE